MSAVRSELAVAVRVGPVRSAASGDALPFVPWMSREAGAPLGTDDQGRTSSQQQQQ